MPASRSSEADWRARWLAIVDKLSVHSSGDDVRALLARAKATEKPLTIAFVNAHAMNLVVDSPAFYQSLMSADVLLRDGVGLALLMRALGREPGLNMNGTDLIPRLLQQYTDANVALFGTVQEALDDANQVLHAKGHLCPVVTLDGFQPSHAYVMLAEQLQPALIVLGMGMPKQEAVSALLRKAQIGPCTVVCGGAIIDFISGKVSRAPVLVRKAGFEWLYRLCLEPKRLFQRYVVGNPLFITRVAKLLLANRQASAR